GNGVPFDAVPGPGVAGAITPADHWIEILNSGPAAILIGWSLELVSTTGVVTTVPIPPQPVLMSGTTIVVPVPLTGGATIRLKDSNTFVWDEVDLSALTAALGPPTSLADEAIARVPNGLDTNTIGDFKRRPATINAPNPF